jgi:spore germination cell wall hydrolase CwlJ-like protein
MSTKSPDVLRRSDRVLIGALSVVLAVASAAVGAAAAYSPHKEQLQQTAAVSSAPATPAVSQGTVSGAAPVPVSDEAAPGLTGRSGAEQLVMNKLLAEHRCLSEALYYEARGEGAAGQKAIAEVIFTRMKTGNYGHSICAVVYEGASQPHCQFSFTCNGDLARPKQAAAWMRAQQLAARILTGEVTLRGVTGGATNFHAVSVEPDWSYDLARTTQIGNHIFYKDPPHSRSM